MKKSAFLWVLFLPLLSVAYAAYTQDSITVGNSRAAVIFPFYVSFQLEAESTADIDNISLQYGTNSRSCQAGSARQSIDFEADTQVDVAWQWDLSLGSPLPPGVKIWWQWQIEDVAGNSLTTEQQEITLEDRFYDWQRVSQDGVVVYWYEGNAAFGHQMLDIALQSLERLSEEAGITRPEAIQIWIYPTAEDVRDAIVNVPEWTGGVAFPEYNITVIGVAPGETNWASEVIPHELSHLVVGIITFNCRGIRLPTWLDEGLARYSEGAASSSEITQLQTTLANGRLPSLRSLANGFSAYSDGAALAYTQSGQVVQFLIEQYGPEQMNHLLLTMQGGLSIDEALKEVYGFDTSGLDARWREAQGYPATPTSEADAAVLQATPTLVPTLSLGGIPVAAVSATPTLTDTPLPLPTETIPPSVTPTVLPATNTPQPAQTPSVPAPIVEDTDSSLSVIPILAVAGLVVVVGVIFIVRRRG